MLGDELDIAVFETAVRGLILDAQVRQFEMAVHDRQPLGFREGPQIGRRIGVVRPVRTMEKRLIVGLQFVVEQDTAHLPALGSDPRSLGLIQPIELGVVPELAGLDESRVIALHVVGPHVLPGIQECLPRATKRDDVRGTAVDRHPRPLDEPLTRQPIEVASPAIARRGASRQIARRDDSNAPMVASARASDPRKWKT